MEQLVESQRGVMDNFFTSNNQIGLSAHINTIESIENEVNQEEGNKDLGTEEGNRNENDQNISNENEDEVYEEMNVEWDFLNIDDSSNWDKMDQNLRDMLVERGPARRDCDFNFPDDDDGSTKLRHLSSIHYVRHLANGGKHDRKWLIYSKILNRVFCFCCKLFKQEGNNTQLAKGDLKIEKILF